MKLTKNKKVICKMKDEFGGVIITGFVGLKSKIYSIKKIDGKEHNTAKYLHHVLTIKDMC